MRNILSKCFPCLVPQTGRTLASCDYNATLCCFQKVVLYYLLDRIGRDLGYDEMLCSTWSLVVYCIMCCITVVKHTVDGILTIVRRHEDAEWACENTKKFSKTRR